MVRISPRAADRFSGRAQIASRPTPFAFSVGEAVAPKPPPMIRKAAVANRRPCGEEIVTEARSGMARSSEDRHDGLESRSCRAGPRSEPCRHRGSSDHAKHAGGDHESHEHQRHDDERYEPIRYDGASSPETRPGISFRFDPGSGRLRAPLHRRLRCSLDPVHPESVRGRHCSDNPVALGPGRMVAALRAS